MKWSLLVGRFFGTEIRMHASLLLLIPYALIAFQPTGWTGALRVLLLIAAIFVCVGMHEIGHTIAARLFGIHVTSIMLWPLGGVANLSSRPEKVLPDLIISAAGPLTNLLIFGFLGIITATLRILEVSMYFPEVSHFLWRMDAFPFLLSLTIANLTLALFNLVPVYPLDGGQIARGALKVLFGERIADLLLMLLSLPAALALVVAGIAFRDVIIIVTGLILFLGGITLNTRLLNNVILGGLYFLDRGGFYLKRSDFDAAVRAYSRAIQHSPQRAGLYVSRAVAYINLFEVEHAKADINRALDLDANAYLAWTMRGELLALQKDFPAAMECYNRALELRPQWTSGYIDRGELYQKQGDLNRALEEMNKGITFGKGSPFSYLMRSILHFQMGDREAARKDAGQALRFAPHWMLVFPEFFLLNLEGHLEWVLDYYELALQRMPNAYQVYQGRADALRYNQRPDWAIEDYHRAVRLAPRQAEPYLNRARTYQQLGKFDYAAADFRQAAALAKRSHIRRFAEAGLRQVEVRGSMAPALASAPATSAPAAPGAISEPNSPLEPPGEAAE